jgi:hypothetical protein
MLQTCGFVAFCNSSLSDLAAHSGNARLFSARALRVRHLLRENGIDAETNSAYGFAHKSASPTGSKKRTKRVGSPALFEFQFGQEFAQTC